MSGGPRYDKRFYAEVLLCATYVTDDVAIERYGIGRRTLQRMRKLSATDLELAQLIADGRDRWESSWRDRALRFLPKAIDTLEEIAVRVAADPVAHRNPELIRALSESFATVSQATMASRVIDARISQLGRVAPEAGTGSAGYLPPADPAVTIDVEGRPKPSA